jgi:NADH-quinone oxidoreductase subunit M
MNEVTTRHPPADLGWSEKLPAFVLLAALLFVGLWPKSISDPINVALAGMTFPERTMMAKAATRNALP